MAEIKIGIYKITSPSGKIYIGQSRNIYKRWMVYRQLGCRTQPKVYRSIKKYGIDKHIFEIIEECVIEFLNEREVHYINLYDTFATPHGMNLKVGGNSGILSPESLKKIGDGNRGKKHTEEAKRKISKNHARSSLGKKASPETREKIRQARLRQKDPNLGKKRTGIALQNIINSRVPISPELRKKMSDGVKNSQKAKNHNNSNKNKEHLRKIRENYTVTEEHKQKLKEAWKTRKPMSEETVLRIANGNRERNKLRAYKRGYKLTEDHKQKLRESKAITRQEKLTMIF